MTLSAAFDVRDGSARLGADASVGRTHRRPPPPQLRLVTPLLAGGVVAQVSAAEPVVAAAVLISWALAHLHADSRRLRPGQPDRRGVAERVAVPFMAAALAVAFGVVGQPALVTALLVSSAATVGLVVTEGVLSARRTPTRILLVGDRAGIGRAVTAWSPSQGAVIVGAVLVDDVSAPSDDELEPEGLRLVTCPGLDGVADRARDLRADVVAALPSASLDADGIRRLSWALEERDVTLVVRTELDNVATHRVTVSTLAGCTVAEISPSRAPGHVRTIKSVIDRAGAALLLVVLSPVLAGLVMAVRLDSRGPGLFTQTRVGRDGRHFKIYKMRTMSTRAEAMKPGLAGMDEGNGVLFKVRQDPRVTRVGRFLRRTSLDELPQLINVVRGEMALVGPRPALPQEAATYDEVVRRRLAVRPGITGLWQVSGRSDLDWDRSVDLDLRYTDNITIASDLQICLRTVAAVTSGRGAY